MCFNQKVFLIFLFSFGSSLAHFAVNIWIWFDVLARLIKSESGGSYKKALNSTYDFKICQTSETIVVDGFTGSICLHLDYLTNLHLKHVSA